MMLIAFSELERKFGKLRRHGGVSAGIGQRRSLGGRCKVELAFKNSKLMTI